MQFMGQFTDYNVVYESLWKKIGEGSTSLKNVISSHLLLKVATIFENHCI